uniref:ZP domain-containing protein n=1 Tax=Panagrellus redivivus TaxID=6233 RepID=A0A7E4V726_PANRE
MQFLTVVLIFAMVAPVVSRVYYARIIANFVCNGAPVAAQVELMEANDSEASHEHLLKFNIHDGKVDLIAKDQSLQNFIQKALFQDTKTDFFFRVHHDCGCGAYFDTPFVPHADNYKTENEANEKPYDYGTVEISKCR